MRRTLKYIFLTLIGMMTFIPFTMAQSHKGDFGVGIFVGEPSIVTGKVWTDSHNAVDMGLGWSFGHDSQIIMQGDYLHHMYNLVHNINKGQLLFYYGVGGRLILGNNDRLGVRVPLGADYLVQNEPIEAFFEIAPVLDLAPKTEPDINAGIGVRYYFGGK